MHNYAQFLGAVNLEPVDQMYVSTLAPLASIMLGGAYHDCLLCITPRIRQWVSQLVSERLEALWRDPSIFGFAETNLWWLELTAAQWERFVQVVYARYVLRRLDIFPDSLGQAVFRLSYRLQVSCKPAMWHVRRAVDNYMLNVNA